MSGIFALDRKGAAIVEEEADANPLDLSVPHPPGMWDNFAGATAQGAVRGVGVGGFMLGTAGAVIEDKIRGNYNTTDAHFRRMERFIDDWTPDAETTGTAGQIGGGLASVITPLLLSRGNPAAASFGTTTVAVAEPGMGLVRQGVDADTAMAVAGVQGAANLVGFKIPTLGSSLLSRMAWGGLGNLAVDVPAGLASGDLLEGYDAAEQYGLTRESAAISLGVGLAFGVAAHATAPRVKPSERAALLALHNADHFANRSMPGTPLTPEAAIAHQDQLGAAINQILADQPVALPRDNLADFLPRPGAAPAPAPAASGYDAMLVALESGGRADAKAPTSSATGLHQFTDGTWLATVRKAAPAWAAGLDDAQLLAQRTDPGKSSEMERALRAENAAALTSAGQEASPFNLYAAHHFGSGKGVAFAKAAGDTPMAAILTKGQLNANPYLKGLTKAEAIANWTQRARRAGVHVDGSPVDTNEAGQALRKRLVAEPEKLAADYALLEDSAGGTVLNTDTARELSPEYLADRTRSADVHEAASDFVKTLYETKLAQPTPEGLDATVLFTAGGTGAGKTTAIREAGDVFGRPEITYDTNMNTLASAVDKVEQAIAAGRNVQIAYVYRDPVESLTGGAIPRAQRQAVKHGSGRTVPLEEHARTHLGVRPTMEALAARYADDPRVEILAVDNSRGRGKSAVAPLESLPRVEEDQLRERLQAALEEARAAGLDESLYRGFAAAGRGAAAGPTGAGSAVAGQPRAAAPNHQLDSAAGGQPQPPESLTARAAADTVAAYPDLMVMGEDGIARPASDVLAEADAQAAQADETVRAIQAAASCFLRTAA